MTFGEFRKTMSYNAKFNISLIDGKNLKSYVYDNSMFNDDVVYELDDFIVQDVFSRYDFDIHFIRLEGHI